jgi:glutaredoxin
MAEITVFGADWCPDCRRSKGFLDEQRISYSWVDLDRDPGAKAQVERLNGAAAIIPTIVFPDGSHLAEPTNEVLAEKLGLRVEPTANGTTC